MAERMKWVSVKDALPKVGLQVIAYRPTAHLSNDPPMVLTHRIKGGRTESWQGVVHEFDCLCHPSHWMYAPEVPRG